MTLIVLITYSLNLIQIHILPSHLRRSCYLIFVEERKREGEGKKFVLLDDQKREGEKKGEFFDVDKGRGIFIIVSHA